MTALTKKNNVVFISLEMSEEKMINRFAQYLTGMPAKEKHVGCEIPFLREDGVIGYEKSTKPLLTPFHIIEKLKDIKQILRGNTLKLICWPSDAKTFFDIKSQIEIWKTQENFIPDVIVVDYADLLAPVDRRLEYRHQLDSIWKGLKKLAQETRCLVVTASQTDKKSYSSRIHKGSMAEDKRKASHCDRILALNQSEVDKKRLIMRVSILFDRHDSEQNWKEVVVLQQLAIGKAYLGSYIENIEV